MADNKNVIYFGTSPNFSLGTIPFGEEGSQESISVGQYQYFVSHSGFYKKNWPITGASDVSVGASMNGRVLNLDVSSGSLSLSTSPNSSVFFSIYPGFIWGSGSGQTKAQLFLALGKPSASFDYVVNLSFSWSSNYPKPSISYLIGETRGEMALMYSFPIDFSLYEVGDYAICAITDTFNFTAGAPFNLEANLSGPIWSLAVTPDYQTAFNEGVASVNPLEGQSGFFDMVKGSFESIGSVLSVEILPNFTIGTLLFIPLCFAVVLFLIRLVKGE